MSKKLALVLCGGGARAAYQAGALLGINEILETNIGRSLKPQIFCGTSSGSINASFLASRISEVPAALKELWKNWDSIRFKNVIDTRSDRLASTAFKLLLQLGGGGWFPGFREPHLLNTLPLKSYLAERIDFDGIRMQIDSKALHGIAVTLTNYGTGSSVTFYDGSAEIQPWMRSHRLGRRARIRLKHILASSAIPILFPPMRIGGSYYGDGAMRMTSPLSPAIHLGADKILAIGMRYHRTPAETYKLNSQIRMKSIRLAEISGAILNSLFLDALDADLERMLRINQTLTLLNPDAQTQHPEKLRIIPVLAIRPSQDLGKLAINEFRNFSGILKHLLRGLGASEQDGSDFISYMAFESSYTSRLLELGYRDILADQNRILEWFSK